jgi:hypothetical protein
MVDARPAGWAEVVARRFFFPPRLGNAAVLQEGVSNHRHKSVTMKTVPEPSHRAMTVAANRRKSISAGRFAK